MEYTIASLRFTKATHIAAGSKHGGRRFLKKVHQN
jgi:hypothetical protein